jgi:hypothetical protein
MIIVCRLLEKIQGQNYMIFFLPASSIQKPCVAFSKQTNDFIFHLQSKTVDGQLNVPINIARLREICFEIKVDCRLV